MKTYKKLKIEFNQDVTDIITAVQNDTESRYLDIELYNNGQLVDLTGHTVRMYSKKVDDTEVYNDGVITNPTGGRVEIPLTTKLLALANVVYSQVIVYNNQGTEILSSNIFKIFVTKSLIDDSAIESSNEYGSLVILFQNVYEAITKIDDINNKLGIVGNVGEELSVDTVFKQLEWLIDFSRNNSVGSLGDRMDRLEQKVNTLLDLPSLEFRKNFVGNGNFQVSKVSRSGSHDSQIIYEVTGQGYIRSIYLGASWRMNYITTANDIHLKVTIDDEVISNIQLKNYTPVSGTGWDYTGLSVSFIKENYTNYENILVGDYRMIPGGTLIQAKAPTKYYVCLDYAIPFSKNFKIETTCLYTTNSESNLNMNTGATIVYKLKGIDYE